MFYKARYFYKKQSFLPSFYLERKNIMYVYIILGVLGGLLFLMLLAVLFCFLLVFYSPKRRERGPDEYDIPKGNVYEPFRDEMIDWIKECRAMPRELVEIKSHDGLTLRGIYYEYKKGAPLEILFHGYRGDSERDLAGGVFRCHALCRNVLLVDQRASGRSDGRVITFGVKEKLDCLRWVDFAIEKFGEDTEIVITGVSMGAATVMLAAGEALKPQVKCVLADCGYTSGEDIIKKVLKDIHLPVSLFYSLIKLGARLFGGFDISLASPIEAVKKCKIPVIFIHGENDGFVPCEMSRELYGECAAEKAIFTVPGAAHGLAFPVDREGYFKALKDFESAWRNKSELN